MGKNNEMGTSVDGGAVAERTLSYFASDGNYGGAAGLTVIETTHWSEVDWELIEAASDWHRPEVARVIAESYEADKQVSLAELKERFLAFDIDLDDFKISG